MNSSSGTSPGRFRVVSTLALASSLGFLVLTGPAAATPAAGPGWSAAVTALDPGCQPDVSTAAATAGPDGRVHGFAGYVRGTCTDDPLWYFQGRAGRWAQARSPYHGDVLATAADSTGSWLLYLDSAGYDRVMLGRRTRAGGWAAPRTISTLRGSAVGSGVQGAALVARGGRWWAVWAQALPDPDSSSPATRLFQAGTLGGPRPARPITTPPAGSQETNPALALLPGRAGGAVLVWARDVRGAATGTQNDELRFATSAPDGRWRATVSVPAGPGPAALHPVLSRAAGTTWLAWQRQGLDPDGPADSAVLITPQPARPREPAVFTAAGGAPVIAAGPGRVDVAWPSADRTGIVLATRAGGGWSTQTVRLSNAARSLRPLAITAAGRTRTLVVQSRSAAGRIYAVTG
ncbi:hypothetical protein [Actinoplanes sp. NPDC049599]|uniref:hypothetical protein n=1 Tax=Actinoplanes sp. NPDC049599 TaxID=3363903 RepID=UPI0037921C2E